MNFKTNTGLSIQDAFDKYHSENPNVYEQFKRLALTAINKGKKKISFKMLLNVVRWEVFIQTSEPTLFDLDGKLTKFKINDAYSSRYARLFIKDYPEHEDKIEFRELRA